MTSDWHKGKKSYLVAVGVILYAVIGVAIDEVTPQRAMELIFAGLGLSALRSAIKNG